MNHVTGAPEMMPPIVDTQHENPSVMQRMRGDEGFIGFRLGRRGALFVGGAILSLGGLSAGSSVQGADLEQAQTTAEIGVLSWEDKTELRTAEVIFKETLTAEGVKFKLDNFFDAETDFVLKGHGSADIYLPLNEETVQQTVSEDGSVLNIVVQGSAVREKLSWDEGKTIVVSADDREKNIVDMITSGASLFDNPLFDTKGKDEEIKELEANITSAIRQKGLEAFRGSCGDELQEETKASVINAMKEVAELQQVVKKENQKVEVSVAGPISWTASKEKWDGGKFEIADFPLDKNHCSVSNMKTIQGDQ